MSGEPNRDYWRYILLVVTALLGIANGIQYRRYQKLEADHRALKSNADGFLKTANQLRGALDRMNAKHQRQGEEP